MEGGVVLYPETHHDVSVYRLSINDRCRSVYTVSDKHLRHGGSGYETWGGGGGGWWQWGSFVPTTQTLFSQQRME